MSAAELPTVQASVTAVKAAIGAIGRDKKVTEGPARYDYRGIDAILDAAHDALVEHGLVIAPIQAVPTYEMRQTSRGNPNQWLYLVVDWLVMGPAGDVLTCEVPEINPTTGELVMVRRPPQTIGEAADTSDKATNKAHTAAYKILLNQLFAIPFSADDPDAHRPEIDAPPVWTDAKRATANQLQERLDTLPTDLYERAVARMTDWARRSGVDVDASGPFSGVADHGPAWLDAWHNTLEKAWAKVNEAATSTDSPPDAPVVDEPVPDAPDTPEPEDRPADVESGADPVDDEGQTPPPDVDEPVVKVPTWDEIEQMPPSKLQAALAALGASGNGSARVLRERLAKRVGVWPGEPDAE